MSSKTVRSKEDMLGDSDDAPSKTADWGRVRKGVGLTWLFQVFRMDRKTVKKRLGACPVAGYGPQGEELYDVPTAAAYLVKPKFDIEDYMRSMNPNELPPVLRKEFWTAKKLQQEYERNAGDLWRTEEVLNVFAEVFKLIKTRTQLWADDIERTQGLPREQYEKITALVDALQQDIYQQLVEMPKRGQTESVLAEDAEDIEVGGGEDDG